MWIDLGIIAAYFVIIMVIGVMSRTKKDESAEEYFLSSRRLGWFSIALSTIATNIQAGHFIGMAGSAYIFGLAQANFEINAIFGILLAAFLFVPLYLNMKATTITQFFEVKFGAKVALAYSLFNVLLYACMYMGTTLFWGAYAMDALFPEATAMISDDGFTRICTMIVGLGVFSAIYTYLGGLTAVVRTDVVQFVLLLAGGTILSYLALDKLGGWSQLYEKADHLMHLHLERDHPKIPWTAIVGMNLLNLHYWGCNQIILQRALAARSVRHAQVGLMVGGLLKYVMVLIIIIPGIALAGIHGVNPLSDPDQAYPELVNTLLPTGLRGLILCGLFASMMSSVDSIFNSVSTLWSIDVYKRHLKKAATDAEIIRMGKIAIIGTLCTGLAFAFITTLVKTSPEWKGFALTHWFNEMTYYLKNGFVLLITAAVFLIRPPQRLVLATLLASVVLTAAFKYLPGVSDTFSFLDMNYLNRSAWVIILSFLVVAIPTWFYNGWRIALNDLIAGASKPVKVMGWSLLASLLACHVIWH